MKYVILTNMYPKNESLYRNAFIHSRVLLYKKNNLDIEVFVLDQTLKNMNKYTFQGINVFEGNKDDFVKYTNEKKPIKILVHFLDHHMMGALELLEFSYPTIVWIHGVEALGWYRRIFNFDGLNFISYILRNTRQMHYLRRFIRKSERKNVTFIFVSKWMKAIMEKDTLTRIKSALIIPNVIDTNFYQYNNKNINTRKKILLIRPFESKKYANDLAIKCIEQLSKKEVFKDLEFTIYGKGKYFDVLTKNISGFKNVNINNRYLSQKEIAEEHSKHGIFLCPTRQDSQGVSMCEAMASGLVPLTSNNTAIPEFVEDSVSGFLTNNSKELAEKIEYLYYNPEIFTEISNNASKTIIDKCNPDFVINKELEIIKSW